MGRDIYIVRHGNTFDKGDTVTRVGARTDLPLSLSGREQATALARHFQAQGISFTSAIAGPLKRTMETARTILAEQAAPPELETGEFLREIDYGPDENRPEAEVVTRIGQAALDAWEGEAIPPPGWGVDPAALERDWRKCFSQLVSAADRQGPALIVTSNGIARFALLLTATAHSGTGNADLKLKTGAYGVIHAGADGSFALKAWNERP